METKVADMEIEVCVWYSCVCVGGCVWWKGININADVNI